jgi:hypothetical protein
MVSVQSFFKELDEAGEKADKFSGVKAKREKKRIIIEDTEGGIK